MSKRSYYNTKQQALLLNTMKKQHQEFTVKDLYLQLKGEIGLTTIYRMVDKLVSTGEITKCIGKDNITYYQYLGDCPLVNHFYLKCLDCGNLTHIDCDCISDMANHILTEHNFKLNHKQIIINGFCEKCLTKNN